MTNQVNHLEVAEVQGKDLAGLQPDPAHILEVRNLSKHFDIKTGFFKSLPLKAVDDVSFNIKYKETLGLVGESGCGKTTLLRTLLWLYPPTAGDVYFDGDEAQKKLQRAILSLPNKQRLVFNMRYYDEMPYADISA